MITEDADITSLVNLDKSTSLQKWNKVLQAKLKKTLKIEATKDRELIYARLHSLGLPHERCIAFAIGKFPDKQEFSLAVGRIGFPYWISAPSLTQKRLI
ncbi:hypothetical protein GTO10_05180 [Candidatus Saccharibacteria bacterium]|nr:hypothetical protein [Candidatus Saccharibacteria bacterium]